MNSFTKLLPTKKGKYYLDIGGKPMITTEENDKRLFYYHLPIYIACSFSLMSSGYYFALLILLLTGIVMMYVHENKYYICIRHGNAVTKIEYNRRSIRNEKISIIEDELGYMVDVY